MKERKVIRIQKSFSKKARFKRKIMQTFTFLILIVLFVTVGFVLTGYLSERLGVDSDSSQSGSSGSLESSSSESSSTPSSSASVSSDSSSQPTQTASTVKAIAMPSQTAASLADVNAFLAQAKQDGYTAVVLELKNNAGEILYQSSNKMAKTYGAVVSNAFDLSAITAAVTQAGLTPIGQLSTLKDPLAAHIKNENSYRYANTTYNWLDDSPERGGKAWLNPYMPNTKTYLKNLAKEAASKGCKTILLTDLHFPDKFTTNLNVIDEYTTRTNVLAELITTIADAATAKGATTIVGYQALAYLGYNKDLYGGSPAQITASDAVSPQIDLAALRAQKAKLPKSYRSMDLKADADKAVKKMLTDIIAASGDKTVIPTISAEDSTLLLPVLKALNIDSYFVN